MVIYATTMVIPCRYLFMLGFAAIYEIHNFFSEKIELKQMIFKYFTNVFLSLYHEIHVTNHLRQFINECE